MTCCHMLEKEKKISVEINTSKGGGNKLEFFLLKICAERQVSWGVAYLGLYRDSG